MGHLSLIYNLSVALSAALVLGFLTHRVRLSPIVGYLLAGVLIGPHTPGVLVDQGLAEQLAEIGVILLMFGVGLQFHWRDLVAVWRVAVPGAIAQSVTATILGATVAVSFGWSWPAGIVYGVSLAVASTVVLTRVLVDNRELHSRSGHVAIGWLVVEDIFTIVVLVALPLLFREGATDANLGLGLITAAGKVVLLVLSIVVLGSRVIPWLFAEMAETRSRELFTLTVLVVALGLAVAATQLFHVSPALGAFLAGMVVGRTEFAMRAASEAIPMRDAFAVLFFVSVGMLLDPTSLFANPALLLSTLGIIIIGKSLAAVLIVLLLGRPLPLALSVAAALAQIGEFSFILADLGGELGILPTHAAQTLVAASIISITLNPILFRAARKVSRMLADSAAYPPPIGFDADDEAASPSDVNDFYRELQAHRAVIVGYGPVGRTLERLLLENGIQSTIIEMELATVRYLQQLQHSAVYGDASRREVLESAGIAHSGTLVLSASSIEAREEIIRQAREINPDIRIFARTAYIRERSIFLREGIRDVFSGEGEVALALVEGILRDLGATPEQIDRERARVRDELVPKPASAS